MRKVAPPLYVKVTLRQRQILHAILRGDSPRGPTTAFKALARRGLTAGEARGHRLTALGRAIAEACEAAAPDVELALTSVDDQIVPTPIRPERR